MAGHVAGPAMLGGDAEPDAVVGGEGASALGAGGAGAARANTRHITAPPAAKATTDAMATAAHRPAPRRGPLLHAR